MVTTSPLLLWRGKASTYPCFLIPWAAMVRSEAIPTLQTTEGRVWVKSPYHHLLPHIYSKSRVGGVRFSTSSSAPTRSSVANSRCLANRCIDPSTFAMIRGGTAEVSLLFYFAGKPISCALWTNSNGSSDPETGKSAAHRIFVDCVKPVTMGTTAPKNPLTRFAAQCTTPGDSLSNTESLPHPRSRPKFLSRLPLRSYLRPPSTCSRRNSLSTCC